MALRGLTAPDISALDATSVESYNLVKFNFSTPLMYTDAPFDISYGGDVYLSNGTIVNFPDIVETLQIKPNTITILMSGVELAAHALTFQNYKNVQVDVFKKIESTGNVVRSYLGYIDKYSSDEDIRGGTADIKWTVKNHWSTWENKNGRTISHESQQLLFPGDDGFKFAGVTDVVSDFWGERSFVDFSHYVEPAGIKDQLWTQSNYDIWKWGVEHNWANGNYDWEAAGSNEKKLPVAYGFTPISGTPVFRAVTGTNGEYLWVVYALCEGEIDGISDIYIDGEPYDGGNLSAYITMTEYSGTDTQTADPGLVAAAVDWTAACQLKGVAYAVMRFTFNSDVFQGEPVPQFIIRAKLTLDPRDATTTWQNGTNNALALRDYSTNSRYGKGLSSALLGNINASADICDQQFNNHLGGLGTDPVRLISRYSFNGVLDTGKTVKDNVNIILFSMFGYLPWISGVYTLRLEAESQTSVFDFDETNIANSVEVSTAGVSSYANRLTYQFTDSRDNYVKSSVIEDSSAFRVIDNGVVLEKTVSNKQETDRYRAKNLAATLLKKSRYQETVKIQSNTAAAFQIETGDLVTVTRESKGWVLKEFIVVDMKISRHFDISLSLLEHEPTVTDWSVNTETVIANDSVLASPFFVPQITGLSLSSGTGVLLAGSDGTIISRIYGAFTAAASAMIDHYDVMYKKSTDTAYNFAARISKDDAKEFYISPVEDGLIYNVAIYSVNTVGLRSTPYLLNETVLGKTVPPTAPTGLVEGSTDAGVVNLAWTGVSDVDLDYYEIWSHTTNDRSLAARAGTASGTEFNHATTVNRYYWIRAVDTSQLVSTWFPVSSTGGVLGQPDGLTTSVQWADILDGALTKPEDNATLGADWDTNLQNIPESYIYNIDDAIALGFNPSFSSWTTTYPDGWAGWSGTVVKETTDTNIGKNAVRLAPTGGFSVYGIQSSPVVDFNIPLPTGSFVLGAISYKIKAYTQGICGVYVRLYTNSALTTYVETLVPFTPLVQDVWMVRNWKAGVGVGQSIYGIKIFLAASYVGGFATTTNSILDVIYDSLRFSFLTAAWGDISATLNAPEDNATVGATWDVNVTGDALPDSFRDTDLIRHEWMGTLDRWGVSNATLSEGLKLTPTASANATAFLVQRIDNKWTWLKPRLFSCSFTVTGTASHSTTGYSFFTIGGIPSVNEGAGIAFRRVGSVMQCYGYMRRTTNLLAIITGATFTDGDSVRFEMETQGGAFIKWKVIVNGTEYTAGVTSITQSPNSVGTTDAATIPYFTANVGLGFSAWVSDFYFHQKV